jgi:hypothetical protein
MKLERKLNVYSVNTFNALYPDKNIVSIGADDSKILFDQETLKKYGLEPSIFDSKDKYLVVTLETTDIPIQGRYHKPGNDEVYLRSMMQGTSHSVPILPSEKSSDRPIYSAHFLRGSMVPNSKYSSSYELPFYDIKIPFYSEEKFNELKSDNITLMKIGFHIEHKQSISAVTRRFERFMTTINPNFRVDGWGFP